MIAITTIEESHLSMIEEREEQEDVKAEEEDRPLNSIDPLIKVHSKINNTEEEDQHLLKMIVEVEDEARVEISMPQLELRESTLEQIALIQDNEQLFLSLILKFLFKDLTGISMTLSS